MRYLLDADTCIAVMRHHPIVLQHLAGVATVDCGISTITRYELLVGVQKCADPAKEKGKVDSFVAAFRPLGFGNAAAEHAARIRAYLETQGTPIGPYDTLLAGQALALSLIVVTANVKEFSRVPALPVENWRV